MEDRKHKIFSLSHDTVDYLQLACQIENSVRTDSRHTIITYSSLFVMPLNLEIYQQHMRTPSQEMSAVGDPKTALTEAVL